MRTQNPKVIVLCGLAGSGKSTCADHLINRYGFDRIKFAAPLKDMLRTIGLTQEHLEGGLKEQPCDILLGQSPRYAMQTLGTEWGRGLIHPDIWVHLWKRRVSHMLNCGISVVVDDCRFPNELEAALEFPNITIGIERPGAEPVNAHISEQYMLKTQHTIINEGTVKHLCSKLEQLLGL